MKYRRFFTTLFLLIFAVLACCNCSNKPKEDQSRQNAIDKYCESIGKDADDYFSELSESACGIIPERIYYSISKDTSDMLLNADPYSWQEMLEKGNPRLIVGLHKKAESRTDEDDYSDEEIRQVLTAAAKKGIVLKIYFDNDHLIYNIENENRIIVEEAAGADGGAYRNTYEYEIKD